MNRLKDKVAILTGAGGGICGKASELFCAEGAKCVMVGRHDDVIERCESIKGAGGDAIAIVADVSIRASWDLILSKTLETYGRVDCCVNGAAEFAYSDWDCLDMDEWNRVIDTNLKSMMFSYQTVLQYMLDNGIKGNFINFSSSTGLSFLGYGCASYPITKAGILLVTKDMVAATKGSGVRFNCLAPNYVWTPKQEAIFDACHDFFMESTPLGFLGEPEDAAWAMVYLASDEAKYVSGVCLPVDGGWSTCH